MLVAAALAVVGLAVVGAASAPPDACPPPAPRPRAVYLSYTWGSGPSSCSPYFVRSWIALPASARAQTDLRILWEGSIPPCNSEPIGGGAQYVKMPEDVLVPLRATRLNAAAYRMRAFTWWLATPEAVAQAYGYVGILDSDMIFQADLFDVIHEYGALHAPGRAAGAGSAVHSAPAAAEGVLQEVLHLVSENPSERNGLHLGVPGYAVRRLHLDPSCDKPLANALLNASVLRPTSPGAPAPASSSAPVDTRALARELAGGRRLRAVRGKGSSAAAAAPASPHTLALEAAGVNVSGFWALFGHTHRLNLGSMFGTTNAVIALCEQVFTTLVGPLAACWDQGILNVLTYTNLLDVPLTSPTHGGGTPTGATVSGAGRHHHHHAGGGTLGQLPSLSARVFVWDCFEGPVKTLDVGGLRDEHGRFYNERGALYSLVHQFRPTRHKKFAAWTGGSELDKLFPKRAATEAQADAAYSREAAWQPLLYPQGLQRVPLVWDDKRRMERLYALHRTTGIPNPADPSVPLPTRPATCAGAAERFAPCAHRDRKGRVHGEAWEAMAREGFVARGGGAGGRGAGAAAH